MDDALSWCVVTEVVGNAEIARPDNAAPYCKGGHRETCFSVRVEGHYKFMLIIIIIIIRNLYSAIMPLGGYRGAVGSIIWAAHRELVFSSISFCISYSCGRQTKLASSPTDTRIAHASQNRACPHGTSAKPTRGATMHTSQQSSEVVAAVAVADSDAPEVDAAGTGACLSSSSSSLLLLQLSSRGCRDSVWAPTEWLTARRNCRRL